MASNKIWVRMLVGPQEGRVLKAWPDEARRYFRDGWADPVETDDDNIPIPEPVSEPVTGPTIGGDSDDEYDEEFDDDE